MGTTQHIRYTLSALLTMWCLNAAAVAFKLKNDASFSVRARVHDRGAWMPWMIFNPGGWADFGPKVERTTHHVQLDVWTGQGWKRVYSGVHGSHTLTRVMHIMDGPDGDPIVAWWDEPPTCRGMPIDPRRGGRTCLMPSGWLMEKFTTALYKVGAAWLAGQ